MANGHPSLQVLMNGYRVGILDRRRGGDLVLRYDPEWQKSPGGRPVSLSMPLGREVHRGDVVYNFIDNLLPDNPDIRQRIQRRFACPTGHPFDLLCAVGADCVGALQFAADGAVVPDVRTVRAEHLDNRQIEKLLRGYLDAPLGMAREHDDFRISLAGAQEKTALLLREGKWHLPGGSTPTSHILKLPIGLLRSQGIDLTDSCENEWLCMQCAAAFGLPVADARLNRFADIPTLVVTRFDRQWAADGTWLMRLPQEDMCQVMGCSPGLKYESDGGPGIIAILELLSRSQSPRQDQQAFLKAQVLFWLLAAIDGHGKNFSIRLLPGGGFSLTPLYDILYAHPLVARRHLSAHKIKMAMALQGGRKKYYSFRQIRSRLFLTTARRAGVPVAVARGCVEEMFDRIESAVDAVAGRLPGDFPAQVADSVFTGMRKVRDRAASPME